MPDVKFPADGSTKVVWVPGDDGIADVSAPTDDELTAVGVVDLSCHIQSGGLDLGIATATIDTASLCSAFVSQSNGRTTVAPTLTGWRYKQPDDTFWDLVEKGELGFLVIRTGKDTDLPFIAGDQVTVAFVEMSEPTPSFPGGDTMTTFQVSLALVNGQMFDQKAVVVAAP